MFIGIVGVLLAVIGMAAMVLPIYLDQYDMYGIKVDCGNGLSTQFTGGTEHDGQFAAQCADARLIRRLWALPVGALGWLLVTGFLVMWSHGQQKSGDDGEPQHYVPHPEIAGPVTGPWHPF